MERKLSKDSPIVALIMKMIDLEPPNRPTIDACLKEWNDAVMPKSYSRVFFQLSSSFVRPTYLYSDLKISLLRKYMPSIWRTCFDSSIKPSKVSKMFHEPIERIIFEKLREDGMNENNEDDIEAHHNRGLYPGKGMFDFLPLSNKRVLDFDIENEDKEAVIILIHWIGAFVGTCFYPQSRRCAIEMLQVIGR